MAALIAGIVGALGALGGAVAGGIAAIRGARIGAERTATAALQQVADQERVEHRHWLRQQRQEAYVDFLAHFEAFEALCRQMRGYVVPPIGNEPQIVDLDALVAALDAMHPSALRIPLLGTHEVVTKAAELVQAAGNACHAFSAWNRHLSRPDSDISVENMPRGLVERLLRNMLARRDEFTSAAKQVLVGAN